MDYHIGLYLTVQVSMILCLPLYLPKILYALCLCPTDCDIQLFSPSGVFENPTTSNTNHTCRILINAPPSVKIRIQALHIGLVFNATNSQSTYIMVQTSFLICAVVPIYLILWSKKICKCNYYCNFLSYVCCSDPGHGHVEDQRV